MAIPSTFIFRDLDQPRQSFVMVRGQYNKPGEKVEPGVPAVLPPLKKPDARPPAPTGSIWPAGWSRRSIRSRPA